MTKFDTYPGSEEFSVTVDHYAVADGKYLYFDLPFTPSLFPARTDQRQLPLYIPTGGRNRISTQITLPPEFRRLVIVPPDEKLAATGGTALVTASEANGQFALTHEMETTPAIVAPAEYPALLSAESALREKPARAFLLQAD